MVTDLWSSALPPESKRGPMRHSLASAWRSETMVLRTSTALVVIQIDLVVQERCFFSILLEEARSNIMDVWEKYCLVDDSVE